jgi:ketosteroid isomerase-like protein
MNSRFTKLTVLILTFCFAGALLAACQPIQPQVATVNAASPSEEEQFTQVVLAREAAYYDDRDLESFFSFYAEEVISMPPGAAPSVGKADVEAATRTYLDEYDVTGSFRLISIEIAGDYATRYGEWTETRTPKAGGESITEMGSCVAGWKKINGEWKMVWDIWNIEPLEE